MENSSFLKNIIFIIKKNYPKRFVLIFFAGTIAAFLEILSLGTIPLFVGFILSPELFIEHVPFDKLKLYLSNLNNYSNLILILSGLVLLAFLIKNLFLSILLYFEFKTIHKVKRDLNTKIYNHYVLAPYEQTINTNPSHLSRNIILEISSAVAVLVLGLNFLREIFVVIALVLLLMIKAPSSTTFIVFLLVTGSSLFYLIVKKPILKRARENIAIREKLIRIVNETFGSLKNLKILLMEKYAIDNFKNKINIHEQNQFLINFLNRLPRIFLEIISITLLVIIVVYLIQVGEDTNQIIPGITLLAIAIVRLVPSFNAINVGLNNFKAKGPSLNLVAKEIEKIEKTSQDQNFIEEFTKSENLKNFNSLTIKNVNYKYPNSETEIFKDLSLEIKKGDFIGIVGETGSGKSTLINLILGLLKPNKGSVYFNNENIFENIKGWRKLSGYVSQDIFLNDDTIKNNITLANYEKKIDQNNLDEAIKTSKLGNFISELPEGLETIVGRDGIKLSGGQKQRISIARAIYRNPKILFLDESTSALDPITEREVINNIKIKYKNYGTVIMISHKSKSLENCDCIYKVDKKKIQKISE